MQFEREDGQKLAKIGVKNVLDLALLIPKKFEDLSIKESPNEGENVVQIECENSHRGASIFAVNAFCVTWQTHIKIVIFNARPWHFATFRAGSKCLIHGKSALYNGLWQFTNPKIITQSGAITPKFKLDLRDTTIVKLMDKYLNLDALMSEGLNKDESEYLLDLHKNDSKSVEILAKINSGENEILKFIEIFAYLKRLSKKKTHFLARKFLVQNIDWWIKSLPFVPTLDQLRAINDIRGDFSSDEAQRRVVMGDVGSGKTLVIFAAALMAGSAILMVPTSILADQIYAEAKRLLPRDFRVKLVKSGEKIDDLDGVNFIIGTHALLYRNLPRANVLMVDEQHRFGSNQRGLIEKMISESLDENLLQFEFENLDSQTDNKTQINEENDEIYPQQKQSNFKDKNELEQKENLNFSQKMAQNSTNSLKNDEKSINFQDKISKLNANAKKEEIRAHFIQFSATPIPRTLSLIQSELVKFSFLKIMPFEKKIQTIIFRNDGFSALLAHLREQISRGFQAIIVYPLVNESENHAYQSLNEGAPFWQKNFERTFITHGKDREKDEILARFRDEGDILVTTTIVEVGISLPRLSIIVIVGAERLGLATLHQLRGRVGRNGADSWCYLYTKMSEIPARLSEFASTLDGFKVAQMDLKNRQAGDLLDGKIQHGASFNYYDFEEEITQKAKDRLASLAGKKGGEGA